MFSFLEEKWECPSCHHENEGNTFLCTYCNSLREFDETTEELQKFFTLVKLREQKKTSPKKVEDTRIRFYVILLLNIVYPGTGFFFTRNYILAVFFFSLIGFISYYGTHTLLFLVPLGTLVLFFYPDIAIFYFSTMIVLILVNFLIYSSKAKSHYIDPVIAVSFGQRRRFKQRTSERR